MNKIFLAVMMSILSFQFCCSLSQFSAAKTPLPTPKSATERAAFIETYQASGVAHLKGERYKRAIADFTKIIELDPENVVAYHHRGEAYARSNNLRQAIQDWNKVIALDVNFADAYYNRGLANYISGNREQAMADYNKYIELDQGFDTAYYNRGVLHHESGNFAQAIKDFERYLELSPEASDRVDVINRIKLLKANLDQ